MTDKQIIIDDQKKTIYRLQDECTEKTNIIIALGEQLNQLKAENEEWKKANDCILTTLNVIAEGNKKLRQTLTEIKEIAEEYQKQYIVNNGVVLLCNQILQKISECEGNDETN